MHGTLTRNLECVKPHESREKYAIRLNSRYDFTATSAQNPFRYAVILKQEKFPNPYTRSDTLRKSIL